MKDVDIHDLKLLHCLGFGGPGMGQFPGMPLQGGPGQFQGMPGQMPGAPGQMPGAPGQIQPLAPPPGLIGNWRLSWNDGDFRHRFNFCQSLFRGICLP